MYRIMVVDDEEIITDSLCRMLRGSLGGAVDVYAAYSSYQALDLMRRAEFDIVVSDIQMPGMTGLELLKQVRAIQSECLVILLTGYDDFNYIYQAMNDQAMRYILKSEDEGALLSAVREAMDEVDRRVRNQQLLQHAQDEVKRCMPILQREYLGALLRGRRVAETASQLDFNRLGIGLDMAGQTLLLAGRLDGEWSVDVSYRVVATVQERLSHFASCYVAEARLEYMLWILQPLEGESAVRLAEALRGYSDTLLRICAEGLGTPVSFVLETGSLPLKELVGRYTHIYPAMISQLDAGQSQAFIFTGLVADSAIQREADRWRDDAESQLPLLRRAMNACDAGAFKAAFECLVCAMLPALESETPFALLLLSRLRHELLRFLEEHEMLMLLSDDAEYHAFFTRGAASGGAAQLECLRALSLRAMERWQELQRTRNDALVTVVNTYIRAHLAKDLSLVSLAEQVYLNPSYLSRRYKEITGRNISDVVLQQRMERACALLRDPGMRVRRIAELTGYTSPSHFNRVFHQQFGLTPQEWRERH